MKKLFLLTAIFLLTLLVNGCSSSSPNQKLVTSTTEKTNGVTNTTLTVSSTDFCKNHGYEIIIRFDKDTQGSKIFCRFPDKKECVANDFQKGICTPEKGAVYYVLKSTPVYNCQKADPPVCGTDGKNYVNHCGADLANIPISHLGSCGTIISFSENTTDFIDNKIGPLPVITSSSTPIEKSENIVKITSTLPDWLKTAGDIIKSQSKSSPSAYIKKCNSGAGTLYYQVDSCPNCFSTLYQENGEVICYPNHDLTHNCPVNFNINNSKNDCTTVWVDNR